MRWFDSIRGHCSKALLVGNSTPLEGEVSVLGPQGEELAVWGAGDFIGEMALISSRPRTASLRAQSPVRVLEIHKPAFESILRERPETTLALVRLLCDRLVAAGEHGR